MPYQETPSLAALLPLKVSGRHYGDNLARVDLLFSSLLHFGAPGLLDEIVVVVRPDEAELIARHIAEWPELPLRMVVEDEYFAAFERYTRPWQLRPWQRQQIIKLNAPAFVDTDFVLMLDPDVLAVKPLSRELLVGGGRALLEPESRSVHRQWWLDSADLLAVQPDLRRPGMNVTPALLSTAILRELHQRLEEMEGRPWMDVLLTSYCDWTEYTLYLLAGERAGLVERHHVWASDPQAPAHLHTNPASSIWDAAGATEANLEQLFASEDQGLFAVVQSNTGLPARVIAAVAGRHFPVRTTAIEVPPVGGRSKVEEKARIVARLVAQRIYRMRRRIRAVRGRGGDQPGGNPHVVPPSMR
jgi:hypothetical protein